MLIEQIIELKSYMYITSKTGYFKDKTKIFKARSSSDL